MALRLGPVKVAGVSVELRNARDSGGPPALALEVGTTLRGKIGPVDFELEGAGVALGIELASGNLGPLDVSVGVSLRANGTSFTNHRIAGVQITYDRP